MSFGLTATLLIRLDARLGHWEPVADLARHCGVQTSAVTTELEKLVASGMVQVQRHANAGDIVSAMSVFEPEEAHA